MSVIHAPLPSKRRRTLGLAGRFRKELVSYHKLVAERDFHFTGDLGCDAPVGSPEADAFDRRGGELTRAASSSLDRLIDMIAGDHSGEPKAGEVDAWGTPIKPPSIVLDGVVYSVVRGEEFQDTARLVTIPLSSITAIEGAHS